MAHLDTREPRPLTSLEIAKILGGIVGGTIGAGVDPADLLTMFTNCRDFLQGNLDVGPGPEPTVPIAGAIGGMIGSLLTWCHAGQVVAAVEWVCDHWVDLVTAVTAADPARTGARGQE